MKWWSERPAARLYVALAAAGHAVALVASGDRMIIHLVTSGHLLAAGAFALHVLSTCLLAACHISALAEMASPARTPGAPEAGRALKNPPE